MFSYKWITKIKIYTLPNLIMTILFLIKSIHSKSIISSCTQTQDLLNNSSLSGVLERFMLKFMSQTHHFCPAWLNLVVKSSIFHHRTYILTFFYVVSRSYNVFSQLNKSSISWPYQCKGPPDLPIPLPYSLLCVFSTLCTLISQLWPRLYNQKNRMEQTSLIFLS